MALPRPGWRDKRWPQPLMEWLAKRLPGRRCRKCAHFVSHYVTGVAADLGDCRMGLVIHVAGTVTRWFCCTQWERRQ